MPQILTCPNPACKKPVQVPDGSGGKQLKCPTCQKMFIVPAGSQKAVKVAAKKKEKVEYMRAVPVK